MTELLHKYQDIFTTDYGNLPYNPLYHHSINMRDATPIRQKPYRIPHHLKTFEKEHIKELLDNGVIQPSTSPWASPILIIPKKGGWRLCVDFRKLNLIIEKDAYPLPRINNLLDQLQEARYFSSLDLFAEFHEISIDLKDIQKTAF